MVLIKYEDFLLNKQETIRKLSEKLNMKEISDISHLLDKQFQPKGKQQKVDVKKFFGAVNYHKIDSICKKNMKKLGY